MQSRLMKSAAAGIIFFSSSNLTANSLGHMAAEASQLPSEKASSKSAKPGQHVFSGNNKINLYKGNIKVGDSFTWFAKELDLQLRGVALVNIVPSVDTPVCEEQSHILGESTKISSKVHRVIISRDTSMAQSRFAKEAKLTNITYASDFKHAKFGKKSGLLMEGPELLARAVLVVDKNGKIVYLQVVENIGKLPDMDKAIQVANSYAEKSS